MQFTTLLRPMEPNNSIPGDCYNICANALHEAQEVGKTPGLCPDDSDFMLSYNSCHDCLLVYADDPRKVVSSYLEPSFSPYISFCQEQKNIDPSWYTLTITWAIATYTNQNGPTVTVTVLVDTTVLRPDWTGFQATTPISPATTTTTSQANTTTTISSSQPLITTSSTPNESVTKGATHGPKPWVWAVVGVVIALVIIGLGALLFLYRKDKLRFMKRKLRMASAHPHELDGDSTWRTGDKPELHGESSSTAAAAAALPVKDLYAPSIEPKELDSSVGPVEMPAEEIKMSDGGRKEAKGEHRQ